jgi:hypothetical protein
MAVKKEYLPMAFGFWGTGLPLLLCGLFFGRTAAERITVTLGACLLLLVGLLIAKAKQ